MQKTTLQAFRKLVKEFYKPELKLLALLIVLTLAAGTATYATIEGWGVVDSLYFSTATLLTIGFEGPAPLSMAGKVFTVFYAILGVGILFGFVTMIARSAFDLSHSILALNSAEKELIEDIEGSAHLER